MSDAADFITLPVRVTRGQFVVCGPSPPLREGATGQVRLPREACEIGAPPLTPSRVECLLPAGAEVRFIVRADRVPHELLPHTLPCPDERNETGRRLAPRLWVPVVLTQPLHLRVLSSGGAVLRGGACRIAALGCTARSLNHAYTLLSERFEPGRLGHSSSVFRKAFVPHKGGWKLLDELRAPSLSTARDAAPRPLRLARATKRDTATGQLFET